MQITPVEELSNRLNSLQVKMRENSLDGVLLTEKMDLFYFAGSMQQGFLFIPEEGEPLYMVKRNFLRARDESALSRVLPLGGMRQLIAYIKDCRGQKGLQKIGLELDVLPVNFFRRLQDLFAGVELVDISNIVKEIRMIKSAYEVNFFRRAGEIARDVHRQIPSLLQVGKPELILSAELETLYRKAGHQGILRMRSFNAEMFFGHVYSGENGAAGTFLDSCTGGRGVTVASPQGAGWRALAPHEPIGFDYASIYEGYILDHTRVYSIGELPSELEKAYLLAVSIQNEVISRALPGASCRELYRLAVEMAADEGLEEFFMGHGEGKVKFIAHGVGLDIDEYPVLSPGSEHLLQPGMVIALEPKFVFPGKGMVGIENVWLVTDSVPEKLSPIPDGLLTVDL